MALLGDFDFLPTTEIQLENGNILSLENEKSNLEAVAIDATAHANIEIKIKINNEEVILTPIVLVKIAISRLSFVFSISLACKTRNTIIISPVIDEVIIESIIAFGIVVVGDFVSSARSAAASNPVRHHVPNKSESANDESDNEF